MTKTKWLVACVALLAVVGMVAAAPSVEEIMTKCHKAKVGLRDQIKVAAEAASPNWADIAKKSKEFVECAGQLDKNDPPKGEKDSWIKLCKAYNADVKALDAAVAKKDAKAVLEANKKLGAGCKGCHDLHQP